MRKLTALGVLAVLGGCAGLGTGDFAYDSAHQGDAILTAEPRPMVTSGMDDDETFLSWGARGGMVMNSTSDKDMPARITVGGYARFLETETRRLEAGIDFVPDLETIDRGNMYLSFAADYVGFIGEIGLYWKAGGGGILEFQDKKTFFLMLMEAGVGFWIPVGEEESGTAAVVNLMLQRPIIATADSENNAEILYAITVGYEF